MPKSASKRLKEMSQRFRKLDSVLYWKTAYACSYLSQSMRKYDAAR